MQNEIQQLEALRDELQARLNRLSGSNKDTHLDSVQKYFHMGMVGGSGRNTASLNRRRARNLDKTIDNAVIFCRVDGELREVERKLAAAIYKRDNADTIAAKKERKIAILIGYWNQIKAGDTVVIPFGNEVTVTKKNAKSIMTGPQCKWTATDIIGREAAARL